MFDVTKLFKFLAIAIFDERKLQEIVDIRSIKKEHQVFVSKREQSFNRMIIMVNRFLNQYKMFKGEFWFEGEHLKEYLLTQKARIEYCLEVMKEVKEENPELALAEEERELILVKHYSKNEADISAGEIALPLGQLPGRRNLEINQNPNVGYNTIEMINRQVNKKEINTFHEQKSCHHPELEDSKLDIEMEETPVYSYRAKDMLD